MDQEVASASGVFAQSARKRYFVREVPLSGKNATSVQRCKRLGALVDGRDGRVAVPPAKSGLVAMLTAHVLSQEISRKDLQVVVAGHWCYLGCFRRECTGVFSQVWSLINNWGRPSTKRHLPHGVKAEFFLALGLLPLHQFDLRAQLSTMVTASDASETGGAVCWSK